MTLGRGGRSATIGWLSLAVAALVVGCAPITEPTERVRPTPTPGPPALRFSSSTGGTFDGRIWTISVIVEPKGLPTDIVLEYHPGLEDGPFGFVIPVAEDVLDVGRVSTQTTDLPADRAFCYRFTATNELGAVSTDPHCLPGPPSFAPTPSGPIVTPSPAAS
jgi:hypothetical protein